MRIAIVQFPGSNCERETMLAVKRAGMEPVQPAGRLAVPRLAGVPDERRLTDRDQPNHQQDDD